MQKNLGEAASGNKELQKAFAALGVKDVRAALNDTDGTLKTVIKSLGEMRSAGERNAAGSKVMGRGFKELAVFIADTKGDLEGVIAEAERAGRVMSTEAANAADEFGDQLDALTNAATIAARNFGIEFVPEITRGMNDMTGALQSNAGQWRQWGADVADAIRGAREVYDSEFGKGFRESLGWLWELDARVSPLRMAARALSESGAQARANDPSATVRSIVGTDVAVMLGLAKQWAPKPAADTSDFFSPAAKAKREKDRKDELERLKSFAKEWDFTISSITGGRHNAGSLHKLGRAVDVDVRGKSAAEIERFMAAAREAGFGVRDERVRPPGQKVWSNPHIHLTTLTKDTQAVNKELGEQAQILDQLARKVADAQLQWSVYGQTSAAQEVATLRQSLGLHKLSDEQQLVAESLLAEYESLLKGREEKERHATATKALTDLVAANTTALFGEVSASDRVRQALIDAGVPLDSIRAKWALLLALMRDVQATAESIDVLPVGIIDKIPQGDGPWVDPATVDPEPTDAVNTIKRAAEWERTWRQAIANVEDLFSNFFLDLDQGFGVALGNMLRDFLRMVAQMLARAAAAKLVKALFGSDSEGGGEDGGGGGWLNTLVTFGTKIAGAFFGGGGFAEGGMLSATPGGQLIQVAEGGYDELVVTTDPKHKERTAKLLTAFAGRTGIIPNLDALNPAHLIANLTASLQPPRFAAGGFTGAGGFDVPDVSGSPLLAAVRERGGDVHIHMNSRYDVRGGQLTQTSQQQIERDAARLAERGAKRTLASRK